MLQTAFISQDLKKHIYSHCDFEAAILDKEPLGLQCQLLLDDAQDQIGHVDLYNVLGDCVSSYPTEQKVRRQLRHLMRGT